MYSEVHVWVEIRRIRLADGLDAGVTPFGPVSRNQGDLNHTGPTCSPIEAVSATEPL